MSIRTQLGRRIVSQFMNPRGLPGRLVGWEMALRPSNRKRNVWAVSLTDVQPSDRVLEIGFGPGIAIREIARRATRGQVVGIDWSAVMRAQAARRNAEGIRAARVSLMVASIDDPPAFDHPFDKVLAVNNMGMWSQLALRLKELAGLLRAGGRVAIVSQPRSPGATAETTVAAAGQIVQALEAAGFVAIRVEMLELASSRVRHRNGSTGALVGVPVPAICGQSAQQSRTMIRHLCEPRPRSPERTQLKAC